MVCEVYVIFAVMDVKTDKVIAGLDEEKILAVAARPSWRSGLQLLEAILLSRV